jgi:hypothetical protein
MDMRRDIQRLSVTVTVVHINEGFGDLLTHVLQCLVFAVARLLVTGIGIMS